MNNRPKFPNVNIFYGKDVNLSRVVIALALVIVGGVVGYLMSSWLSNIPLSENIPVSESDKEYIPRDEIEYVRRDDIGYECFLLNEQNRKQEIALGWKYLLTGAIPNARQRASDAREAELYVPYRNDKYGFSFQYHREYLLEEHPKVLTSTDPPTSADVNALLPFGVFLVERDKWEAFDKPQLFSVRGNLGDLLPLPVIVIRAFPNPKRSLPLDWVAMEMDSDCIKEKESEYLNQCVEEWKNDAHYQPFDIPGVGQAFRFITSSRGSSMDIVFSKNNLIWLFSLEGVELGSSFEILDDFEGILTTLIFNK